MDDQDRAEIERRAYRRYEERGRADGDDQADWFEAEREARESYEQRARELERVAHERLMREQRRLAVDIREQLAQDKRELESVLDNRLEDTVLRPRRGQ